MSKQKPLPFTVLQISSDDTKLYLVSKMYRKACKDGSNFIFQNDWIGTYDLLVRTCNTKLLYKDPEWVIVSNPSSKHIVDGVPVSVIHNGDIICLDHKINMH